MPKSERQNRDGCLGGRWKMEVRGEVNQQLENACLLLDIISMIGAVVSCERASLR